MRDVGIIAEQQRKILAEIMKRKDNQDICGWCAEVIHPKQEQVMIQSTECYQLVHKKCFAFEARKAMLNSRPFKCPVCDKVIGDREMREHLNKEVLDEIDKKALNDLLKTNSNLRQCPCGNLMEVSQGEVNMNAKDDQGNPLTHPAAIHMSLFRVRCTECHNNFCSDCKSQPYHLGKTCEEHARLKVALKCTYCWKEIPNGANHPKREDVCRDEECSKLVEVACVKKKACGHRCGGFKDEEECLPCLQENCVGNPEEERKDGKVFEGVNADSYCGICHISGLGSEPAVQIGCGHIFHFNCVKNLLEKRWVTPRITFNFMKCPTCKATIDCKHSPVLQKLFEQALEVKESVEKKAAERAKFEELHKNPRLSDPKDFYFNKLGEFALFKLAYYMCHQCKNPYFGGMMDCGDGNQGMQEFKPEELVCARCSA